MNKLQTIFFIPFFYTFTSRLKENKSRFAWITTYIIPSVILFYGVGFDCSEIFSYMLSLSVIYASYELGYLYNDAELTQREVAPTLRLSASQLQFYHENKLSCYAVKFFIIIFLCLYLFFVNSVFYLSTIFSSFLIILLYVIYNSIRNRFNIPLYSMLVFLRYYGAFVFLLSPFLLVLLWVVYPLIMTIEFSSKKKYNIKLLAGKIFPDSFRVFSYTTMLIVTSVYILSMGWNDTYSAFYFLVLYYWLYRLLINAIFSRRNIYS